MDFITGVNRLLRINKIIKGDDDNITTFNDDQHASAIELAQIAIQDELSYLVADRLIPYEKTQSSIVSVASTRTYTLASDFVRFYGDNPFLYESTQNLQLFEYPGGEDKLRHQIADYATQEGNPTEFYIVDTTSKKIGLFQTPDSANAGKTYTYDYEKDVSITNASDTIPFHTTAEARAFIQMAARRYLFLDRKLDPGLLEDDAGYVSGKSTLLGLVNPINPVKRYGNRYL